MLFKSHFFLLMLIILSLFSLLPDKIIIMSFTEAKKTEPILNMEQKLHIQLENSKNFIQKVQQHILPYYNAIKLTFDTCWQ